MSSAWCEISMQCTVMNKTRSSLKKYNKNPVPFSNFSGYWCHRWLRENNIHKQGGDGFACVVEEAYYSGD